MSGTVKSVLTQQQAMASSHVKQGESWTRCMKHLFSAIENAKEHPYSDNLDAIFMSFVTMAPCRTLRYIQWNWLIGSPGFQTCVSTGRCVSSWRLPVVLERLSEGLCPLCSGG